MEPGRALMGVFPLIFVGIGITVLVFVWGGDDGPPLFFKIFASFIALGFIVGPGSMALAILGGRSIGPFRLLGRRRAPPGDPGEMSGSFSCPRCGAGLGDEVEVSPSGDAKCRYCRKWFNIHHRGE